MCIYIYIYIVYIYNIYVWLQEIRELKKQNIVLQQQLKSLKGLQENRELKKQNIVLQLQLKSLKGKLELLLEELSDCLQETLRVFIT